MHEQQRERRPSWSADQFVFIRNYLMIDKWKDFFMSLYFKAGQQSQERNKKECIWE